MNVAILSAAGNAFALIEDRTGDCIADPALLARELCADLGDVLRRRAREGGLPELQGRDLDGILLVLPAGELADCRMVIHNADGSRPEACGNGLRCVARFALESGWASGDRVRVETDAGLRQVEVVGWGDPRALARPVVVRAQMGTPRLLARDEQLALSSESVRATLVDMGNPHCVVFVEDVQAAPLERLGPLLEVHPRFPRRTNVELVARSGEGLAVRVWERGVGETAACGTGACAAAVAAEHEFGMGLPIDVDLPGGRLRVHRNETGQAELEGPVLLHALGRWSPGAHGVAL